MTRFIIRECMALTVSLLLLLIPVIGHAQSEQLNVAPPPIGQQLVREGTFALKMASAFSLEAGDDEAEAESRLGDAGIMPRNGWIADYPVTPDIVAELQKSVSDAADAGKLTMNRQEALKKFEGLKAEFGLIIKPHGNDATYPGTPPKYENYPDPAVINNYYEEQGPPVVTYYAPPPDYYYLYGWVPSPFWWSGFWFPGFFILNDFHRTVFIHNRPFFVSNHFNDIRRHRVFRIDPVQRFRGRTFTGISPRTRESISTGVPRSDRTIFNGPSARRTPRMGVPPAAGGGRMVSPPRGGGRMVSPPVGGGRITAPPGGGRMTVPPAGGGGSRERGERR